MMMLAVVMATAMPVPRTGLCPDGYFPSGQWCAPGPNSAPALPRTGSCPSGFRPSGNYCVGRPER